MNTDTGRISCDYADKDWNNVSTSQGKGLPPPEAGKILP